MFAAFAWRRRSLFYGTATVVVATLFSDFIPLRSPGHQPGLWRLLAGDPYVLCGLAVLAGAGIALAARARFAKRLVERFLACLVLSVSEPGIRGAGDVDQSQHHTGSPYCA